MGNKKDYKTLSAKKCKDCNKPLKQNLVDKNPDAERCFKCKKEERRKEILANYRTEIRLTDNRSLITNHQQ